MILKEQALEAGVVTSLGCKNVFLKFGIANVVEVHKLGGHLKVTQTVTRGVGGDCNWDWIETINKDKMTRQQTRELQMRGDTY